MFVPVLGAILAVQAPIGMRSAEPVAPTFARDVAPILNARCIACHRTEADCPDGAHLVRRSAALGPGHQEEGRGARDAAVGRGSAIRPVQERLEPVAGAGRHHRGVGGRGCADGRPQRSAFGADLRGRRVGPRSPRRRHRDTRAAAPAKGEIDAPSFIVANPFRKDVWIQGSQVLPGNRRVVHHVSPHIVKFAARRGRQGRSEGYWSDGRPLKRADFPVYPAIGEASRRPGRREAGRLPAGARGRVLSRGDGEAVAQRRLYRAQRALPIERQARNRSHQAGTLPRQGPGSPRDSQRRRSRSGRVPRGRRQADAGGADSEYSAICGQLSGLGIHAVHPARDALRAFPAHASARQGHDVHPHPSRRSRGNPPQRPEVRFQLAADLRAGDTRSAAPRQQAASDRSLRQLDQGTATTPRRTRRCGGPSRAGTRCSARRSGSPTTTST